MENSIKEDIKNAEHFIKSIKTDKEYKEENGWHGYYNKEIVELARILQHILSDYKRVLKENELAKQTLIKNCNIADERNQLLKENEQLRTEVNSLKEDMSNMYDEEVVISIISDNFNLSRNEVLKLLGGE